MANRYRDIKQFTTTDGITYKANSIYPEVPLSDKDYYVITTAGDRYDTLAYQFYNDVSLWWIIASANNSQQASLAVEPGVQIRIPHDKTVALDLYNQVNKSR
jgi:hypothetical protein